MMYLRTCEGELSATLSRSMSLLSPVTCGGKLLLEVCGLCCLVLVISPLMAVIMVLMLRWPCAFTLYLKHINYC